MTSHELARQLLEGPDALLELRVNDPNDTYIGDPGDCKVTIGDIDVESARARGYDDIQPGPCVVLRGWMSSELDIDEEDEDDDDDDDLDY